jgi:cobalt-zinc-cadmium resistance protein CzcA
VKPRLRGTPGVAEVNTSGGYEKQIVIQPNPDKLAERRHVVQRCSPKPSAKRRERGRRLVQLGGEQLIVRAAGRVQTSRKSRQLPLKFGRA